MIVFGAIVGASDAEETFASPEDAAKALVAAVESGNYSAFLSVAGGQMTGFWSSGDPVRDALERERFLDGARGKGIRITSRAENCLILSVVGSEEFFPAPLIRTETGWRFDGDAGARELAARRVRRNETAAVELCRRFRDAEFTYNRLAHSGAPAFAQRIRSTPGQHDGLFWSDAGESPLGPRFAAAAFAETRPDEQPRPLFGYYFKILAAEDASTGFALVAWPAQYGVDGYHSFLITESGAVYQKNLGPDTAGAAARMSDFNPNSSWKRYIERN